MEKNESKLVVTAIENGTVLDHIPSDCLFKVVGILGLSHCDNQITIGNNLESRSQGRKGIIKIADRFFEDEQINAVALVAPNATINIIRDFKVVEKRVIPIPEEVRGIVRCTNPMCVTNHQPVATRFRTVVDARGVHLLCHYCEKSTESNELEIIRREQRPR